MGTVPAGEASRELRISGAKVFVDGNIIGYCNNPQEMVKSFREKRTRGRNLNRSKHNVLLKTANGN